MKLGISNIAWDVRDNYEIYKIMDNYGFKGLEIAPTKVFGNNPYTPNIDTINKFKINLINNNLELIAMQSILYNQNHLKVFDENTSNDLKNYIKSAIKFAKNLDCPILVFGSPKNREYENDYLEKAYTFFKEIGQFAFENNTKFCIEANPICYGTNFITNLQEQLTFLNYCNELGLGLHIDLGSMIINKEDFNILENLVDKIDHIHLSLPFLEIIRKENIDVFENLKYILKNYENYVSIEMKQDFSNYDISTIEKSLDLVRNLF